MNSVSVFGLGKLGLPAAACLANKGYKVIGVDLNRELVKAVNEGKNPYHEPGLTELVGKVKDSLSATTDGGYAALNSAVSMIIVPTPSQDDGSFATKYVEEAAEQISASLKEKQGFHMVALISTVLPGASRNIIIPLMERVSGKKCGRDFGFCYSPEFIALGSVIRDFTNPDVILIGESDPESGDILAGIYRTVCPNNPPMVRTNLHNAELAKISLNAYITMKITFANTLAEIAESMPGGDADVISEMLGHDSRIGRKYLSGGMAFGGPCFPRDNKAFASVARRYGCQAKLAATTDTVNDDQVARTVALIAGQLGEMKNKNVAVLGLTYKPDTDVIEESAAVKIVDRLRKLGAAVSVYDPAGMENTRRALGTDGIAYADSATACLEGTDFCLLATPWPEFKNLKPEDFIKHMKQPVLLDCWRIYDRDEFSRRLKYTCLGRNSRSAA